MLISPPPSPLCCHVFRTNFSPSISSKASGSNKETHAYTAFGVAPPLDVTTGNWNMLALSSNRVDATSCILNDTTVNLTNTSFSTDNISPTDHTSASKYTKIGRYRSSTSATSTVNNTDMKSVAFFDKYMTVDELKQLYLEGYNANYETGIKSFKGHLEIFPIQELIFRCFNYFEPNETKVVILGQDPYHGKGQAIGLCFGVHQDCKIPPSYIPFLPISVIAISLHPLLLVHLHQLVV
mgnify:CR=1 FL=1